MTIIVRSGHKPDMPQVSSCSGHRNALVQICRRCSTNAEVEPPARATTVDYNGVCEVHNKRINARLTRSIPRSEQYRHRMISVRRTENDMMVDVQRGIDADVGFAVSWLGQA